MTVITISEIRVECHKFEGCPQLFMSLLFPTYDIINDDVLLITEIYNKLKPDIPAEFDFDFTFNFKDLALFNYNDIGLTACRRQAFLQEQYTKVIIESGKHCKEKKGLEIYGWCVLPGHI